MNCLPSEPDGLLPEVRSIAQRLVDDLGSAEKLTRHWADAELTDALVDTALSECLGRLGTECWGEANRVPSGELWVAGSLLEVGSLQYQARFKPHGVPV